MRVRVCNLTKRFGSTAVLRGVSLEIADRELFFLLGPSGCGKTTLLRVLAGFYQPDVGEVMFGDRAVTTVPPHRRNTGMVFQNYALWPHLSVAQNVAYGLEVRGVPASDRRQRVAEALEMVRMTGFAGRSPAELSGGQQQRVALARALVIRPDVLLLDEPLSNLDARLRLEMREEIRRIHDQTRITTLYVTHDQKESLSMADRIAVLRDGMVEQVGTPRELYAAPASRFVADFVGETNWLAAEVTEVGQDAVLLRSDHGLFTAPRRVGLKVGDRVVLGFRPEAVRVGPHPVNQLDATIAQVQYLGDAEHSVLTLSPSVTIKVSEQNPAEARRPGLCVRVHIPPSRLFVLPAAPREGDGGDAEPR